ncbi:sterol desaturase family protein [Ponticaulis profundi]|uniref:Sterol desaturase family protein n=1 Tax=Ponticaulis profundi TaxID=2665222 RepID=A0ABW1SE51_9PROT
MLKAIFAFSLMSVFIPFFLSLALSVWKKGMAAFHWTPGMMKSGASNIALGFLNVLVAPSVYLLNDLVRDGYEALSIPHIPVSFWSSYPFWLILLISLIGKDFADYWNHRLLHKPGFWIIHAVHHSDPDMNHTTSLRVHILESVVMVGSYTVILSWMGLPPAAAAGLEIARSLYNRFVHVDVDIHLGPLSKVIATPRFHQWHHADKPVAYGKNLANIFSFWDVLFGTYYVPGPCKEPLGFEGSPNHNLPKLFFWPLIETVRFGKSIFVRPETRAADI